MPELADKQGRPSPVIVRKSDGGYLYATTDLAALRYRSQTLGAARILYFIDARQSLHMKQVFTLARKAGLVGADVAKAKRAVEDRRIQGDRVHQVVAPDHVDRERRYGGAVDVPLA